MPAESAQGYRFALSRPGVTAFTSFGLVARMPVAMVALAIVLLVSNRTGSYAYAGLLSALLAVTSGLVSIVTSRWADRVGQGLVLRILAISYAAFLTSFTMSILIDAPRVVQIILIIVSGASTPAIGSYVRARWTHISVSPSMTRVGFAWESILDEAVFTVGPVLTTTIAFSVGLPTPLFLAAALVLAGSFGLSLAKRSTPPAHAHPEQRVSMVAVVRLPGLISLVVAAIGMGLVFGSVDVAVVAFTAGQGTPQFAGVVLATFAAASMVGGITYGARAWPGPLHVHARVAAVALTAVALTLPLATTNAVLTILIALAGFSVAPGLIGIFSLASRLVPRAHLTEGLTWTNSGLSAGFALGTAAAGVVIDVYGARAGLALAAIGALGASLSLLNRSLTGAAAPMATDTPVELPPTPAWNDDPLPGPQDPAHT
jgi:MFS family permease